MDLAGMIFASCLADMQIFTRSTERGLSGKNTAILILVLFLFSCKKDNISPLTGDWLQTVSVPEGTMVSTFHFSDNQRYTLDSKIISPENKIILQTSPLCGKYSSKNAGLTFRVDGQTFDWAKDGYIQDQTLVVKDAVEKTKLVFVRLQ
jgi:hypothetical protein